MGWDFFRRADNTADCLWRYNFMKKSLLSFLSFLLVSVLSAQLSHSYTINFAALNESMVSVEIWKLNDWIPENGMSHHIDTGLQLDEYTLHTRCKADHAVCTWSEAGVYKVMGLDGEGLEVVPPNYFVINQDWIDCYLFNPPENDFVVGKNGIVGVYVHWLDEWDVPVTWQAFAQDESSPHELSHSKGHRLSVPIVERYELDPSFGVADSIRIYRIRGFNPPEGLLLDEMSSLEGRSKELVRVYHASEGIHVWERKGIYSVEFYDLFGERLGHPKVYVMNEDYVEVIRCISESLTMLYSVHEDFIIKSWVTTLGSDSLELVEPAVALSLCRGQ